jgi:ankyrin repeat protein
VIKVLLDDGRFDFGRRDCHGNTGLKSAINEGTAVHLKVVTLLLNHQTIDQSLGGKIILCAAAGTNPDIFHLPLNDTRVDINAVSDFGDHAIHIAIQHENLKNLKMMLDDHRIQHWSKEILLMETRKR